MEQPMKLGFSVVALLLACLFESTCHAERNKGAQSLEAWTRQPGKYSDEQNPDRKGVLAIDPFQLKLRTKTLEDIQVGQKVSYRGIALATLVKNAKAAAGTDLVLLHFENGMLVPIPIGQLGRLDAFLALEVCNERGKNCKNEFEPVSRTAIYLESPDPRPIKFTWNKIVVGSLWHPELPKGDNDFSPWLYINSLKGIEFANSAAYYQQFANGKSTGDQVFRARCQYCHSVRYVGAKMGWDFINPLPIYEKRTPATLTGHVKYEKSMAYKMGTQMPPQKDVEDEEMKRVWEWAREFGRTPVRAYSP
jgi:mono/diheme cytochrome c family protein